MSMSTTTLEHRHLRNPLFVRSSERVTSVRVEEGPGHDYVTVWNRGGRAGTLTVTKGDGLAIAKALLPEGRETDARASTGEG